MFLLNKILALLLLVCLAQANEEADPHATPAAGAAAAATSEKLPIEEKQQQDRTKEWMDVVSSLSTLKTKIKSKEDTIKEIIQHKHHAKSKAQAEELVGALIREHKELTKLQEEYNQAAQLLKYRYPDVGLTEKRKYEKLELKSLADYEESQTIEGKIKKTVSKLKTHYGVKEEKKPDVDSIKKINVDNNNLAQPKIIRK